MSEFRLVLRNGQMPDGPEECGALVIDDPHDPVYEFTRSPSDRLTAWPDLFAQSSSDGGLWISRRVLPSITVTGFGFEPISMLGPGTLQLTWRDMPEVRVSVAYRGGALVITKSIVRRRRMEIRQRAKARKKKRGWK
jgi:hypothetical protein